MKKFFTLIAMALMAVGAHAQTVLTIGGQGGDDGWSWGWSQTLGANVTLTFDSQWGEFKLATEGLTEGATYKLVVEEANPDVNLRINKTSDADVAHIPVNSAEITGTIPANTTNIELQGTVAGTALHVLSFTINDSQTTYSTNWGVSLKLPYSATQQWAELMLKGAEGKAGQDITINANADIPAGLQFKVKYSDDTEAHPAIPSGAKVATVYIEKPFKQISIQNTTEGAEVVLDIDNVIASFGVWSVLGSPALFGTSWDVESKDNELTTEDGVTYTLVKENLTLEKGTDYAYKVLKGHDSNWKVNYGANGELGGKDIILNVDETAVYTVTFTFDSQTHIVNATAVKTGAAQEQEHTYSVCGTINGNWDVDTDMTKGDDGNYKAEFADVKAGSYEFKVKVDHDWSPSYPGSNYKFSVDADGSTVVITFNVETHEITHVVTPSTAISTINAAAQQNGVRYNLAGQKVDAGYKGVVIVNGKKVVVK